MPALRDRVLPLAARGLLELPAPVHRALAGRPPAAAAGLAPDAWLLAPLAERGSVPPGALPVDEARRRFALALAPLGVRPRLPLTATDRTVAGAAGPLSARLYVPHGAETPRPLPVYFHGGGGAEGSAATHEPSCRLLAHLAGVRVLSVDYRLAPEHPFPAAADDALAAYLAARPPAGPLGAHPARIAVGGDSAGGNLAAVVALDLRGDRAAPVFQLLIYPGLDMTTRRPSRPRFGVGFVLTEENITWYQDQYVPDHARRTDPRVSPLLAPKVDGLPPAYVATALADPLRDEGEAYA